MCCVYLHSLNQILIKKIITVFIFISALVALVISCGKKEKKNGFSYHPSGYYYQLISFESDSTTYRPNKVAWVTASFKTQSDSIFWDSFNNLNDKFYLESDSSEATDFFRSYVSKCSALDSACILIKTKDFFRQQFNTASIPFFSKNDSVVKINFKVKEVLEKTEFVKIQQDLVKKEEKQIQKYYGTRTEMQAAADPLGFYWVDRAGGEGNRLVQLGDNVTITYQGSFLNGRFLEKSGSDFEFIYGTPDQLLKGINYVIGRLKLGENAKIVLPSRLAFGEYGSSNGTVPPYTPLVYEIKLIDVKPNENTP